MRKKEPLFDEKCLELAEHFLADEPIRKDRRERMSRALAQHIQQAIEDWINGEGDQS